MRKDLKMSPEGQKQDGVQTRLRQDTRYVQLVNKYRKGPGLDKVETKDMQNK